jgi:type IV/VI secretion system ImpK/VasF family protein
LTGGVDEDYGSSSASQLPTERPDHERSADSHVDAAAEAAEGIDAEADREIVPQTRPFRAWGAAHERSSGPSVWDRFVGWLRGLFSRKSKEGPYDFAAGEPELDEYAIRQKDEYAILIPKAASLDEPPIDAPVAPPPAAHAEPLWDTPVIAAPAAESPPNLEASDFSDVWSQRKSPLEGIDWKALEEQPAKPGFFARLFSRKKNEEPVLPEDEGFDDLSAREPADADFAVDALASTAPTLDDFAGESAVNPPSLDHSAADSANLAALLGATPPVEEPIAETPVAETPEDEVPVADDAVDPSLTVDPLPDPQFAPLILPPAEMEAKKAGFFSGLLKRVSRSQFVPKEAKEPEPVVPIMEAPAVVPVEEPHIVEPPEPVEEDLAAKFGPPAAEVHVLGETVPTPMPAVPPPMPPPAAAADVLETTQPFKPFRDARDDFAEDEPTPIVRASQKVDVPAAHHVDDEKTDEFDLVPMPSGHDATAETRVVPGFFGRMFSKKAEDDASRAQAHTRAMPDDTVPFVLAKFRSFYNEVIRDKHQKSDVISGFATAVMGAGGAASESDPEFAAQLLSKRLSEMLELQAAESNWTGGDAAKYYPEAQYAMVALADETFATIDWPGRASWHKYMLEPKMYGTRGADIEFFKRIDRLLKEAPDDKGARDLARLYLMVIASGYRGKFRIPKVRRPLAEYRRRLYEYSHQTDPLELYARDRRVFPQAAAHTLVSRSVGRFTAAQKWIAVVLILAVLYIGISHYAWTSVSAEVRDVTSRIQSSITSPGTR